jgi:monoterpene epsilon-lactone hydrolase
VLSALLGLAVIPFWSSTSSNVAHILAMIILVLAEIGAPLLLAFWTLSLTRQFRMYRTSGLLGAIGLLLVALRSLLWIVNALVPIESGFYGTSGILALLAVAGMSLWLVWLFLLSFRLMGSHTRIPDPTRERCASEQEQRGKHLRRRSFLAVGAKLGTGIAGGAFVVARTGLTIAETPLPESSDVPSEPGFIGTLVYGIVMVHQYLSPVETVAQERALPPSQVSLPPSLVLENVNASGVPAQLIHMPGAARTRIILYVHGGGWAIPLSDQDRAFAASLSQAARAYVLLPEYRLLPENPFPAGLNDCVTAYRWLRQQGVMASRIVVIGGSAGGNLTLALAVALRQHREMLPAALVAMSPPTDLAMTGQTYRTKAWLDPVLGSGLAKNSYVAYTNNGEVDVRNPLVSPLYANVAGFPPTFLQVGTQEVLLSDSIRMTNRLRAAGVEVRLEVWPGMFHGWQSLDFVPEAQLAVQHIKEYIRQHL